MPPRSRKRLIIHAGMHKTGSTSIQAALAAGQSEGAHAMRLGRPNHSAPCRMLFDDQPEQYIAFKQQGLSAADLAEKRKKLEMRVRRQLRNRPEDTFILSAEWFSIAGEAALTRVRDRFSPHFKETAVYAYVRPPADYLRSSLQQDIKTGAVKFAPRWPEYRNRFETIDRVFGPENVRLRVYAPSGFTGGDVVQDFTDWAGLAPVTGAHETRNISMTATALALISCYRRNSDIRLGTPALVRRDRRIVNALMELPGPRFELCPDLAAGIISANADDLAWIEARIGQKLDSPPQQPAGDTWRIGSDADLKLAAAAFAPVLEGGKPEHRAGDPEQADIAAWKKLSEFIARIPETGGS